MWVFGSYLYVLTQFKSPDMNVMVVAVGLVKIVFASFAGFLSAYILAIPGMVLIFKS